ncbi:sensor histidine kinase [Minicystis rosea]|nr:sensor histidine kinase [Minicystis rosea]
MPVFMLPLIATFNWAARRRLGSVLTLATSLAVAAGVALGVSLGIYSVQLRFPHLLPRPSQLPTYGRVAGIGLVLGIMLCAVWALAFVFPFAADDARLRAVEAEKLKLEAEKLKLEAEKLRSAAELSRLRSQLEPHFMLNTLNAIAGLVTQDPREARRLIGCLGDLLRDALHDADEMLTLGEEIAWLRRYAEILESRHAGSLSFHWEIEGSAAAVLLPRLLLQPLVENAVKHGALRRNGSGQVLIRATVTQPRDGSARLVCTVEDNGPGIPASSPRPGAIGLRAVRRRIELKYADGDFRLDSSPEGTRAIVDLPYVTASTPTSSVRAPEVTE